MGHNIRGSRRGERKCFQYYTVEQYQKVFGVIVEEPAFFGSHRTLGYPTRGHGAKTYAAHLEQVEKLKNTVVKNKKPIDDKKTIIVTVDYGSDDE